MTATPTPHAWMPPVAHRRSSSSVARVLIARVAPCVLDLLDHSRPQTHAVEEAVI